MYDIIDVSILKGKMMKKRIRIKMPKDGYSLSNDVSIDEQCLWGILLENASSEFFSEDEHSMSVKDLLYKWSMKCGTHKTNPELQIAIRNVATTVQFSLLTANKKRSRGNFPLIVSAGGDDEYIYYAYSEPFKEKCIDVQLALFLEEQGLSCKTVLPYSFATKNFKNSSTPSHQIHAHAAAH